MSDEVKLRQLPLALPSLNVAMLILPVPMSELDYETLLAALQSWKDALVAAQPPSSEREL